MEYQALHAVPWQHGSFWVFIAIVIFAILFARKIITPINNMLDQRADAVRAALAEAAQLKAEAEAMLADAKARQEQANRDAEDILAFAKREAARINEELTREAQATAKRRERLALERIAAAEKAAIDEVRSVAIDIATTAAATLLQSGFAADTNATLVDHAITGIPSALRRGVGG
jgi:F-type H+-transporting ATPase subunit b